MNGILHLFVDAAFPDDLVQSSETTVQGVLAVVPLKLVGDAVDLEVGVADPVGNAPNQGAEVAIAHVLQREGQ